jgi:hypothetical protein
MSSVNNFIKSITSSFPDELSPLPEIQPATAAAAAATTATSDGTDFFSNVTWQTWIIIILILILLGINIFVYLAKGTQATADVFNEYFAPILKLFGYNVLETTKQTVTNTATGTKAGVDIVANTATGTINAIEQPGYSPTSGTSVGVPTTNVPQGQTANSSLPVQNNIQKAGANIDKWQQGSLEKALSNASQEANQVKPDDSQSSLQTSGKSGWCYIGEDQGIRACAEVGVNDMCMSGDIFPSQEICMNPKLRA